MPLLPSAMEGRLLRTSFGPGPLLDIWGLQAFRAVEVAVRMGLFEALAEGSASPRRLAKDLDADPEGLTLLLRAVEGLGYVNRVPGGYALSPMARRWMVRSGPRNVAPAFPYWEELLTGPFGDLEQVVRSGPSDDHGPWYEEHRDAARARNAWRAAADALAAQDVARRVALPMNAKRILDVRTPSAAAAEAYLTRYPDVEATVHSDPGVTHVARWRLEAAGLLSRCQLTASEPGRLDAPEGHDAAFIFHGLHDLRPAAIQQLLARTRAALRPGALLAVFDVLEAPQTTTAAASATRLQALAFHCLHGGRAYTFGEVAGWLRAAGFVSIRQRRMWAAGGTLLLARKPRAKRLARTRASGRLPATA